MTAHDPQIDRQQSRALGIDFGTSNSVVAQASGHAVDLWNFAAPDGDTSVFRSALCFWEDPDVRGGLGHEAGPWAIAEFLDFPAGSRFLQSFKSVAASPSFDSASLFTKRLKFEELGEIFLSHLLRHGGARPSALPERIVVGRPVHYVGARPDPALARARYDAMFALLGRPVHYVYEPLGAAYGFAMRQSQPATLLVADFGGGTSDFSIVRIEAPDAERRCTPLGSAGIGIAGDRFDYRILDHLVLPVLGKGGTYENFGKVLEISANYYADFRDWSKLALMRNRKTLDELHRLHRAATDPAAIARMIAVVEHELGHGLYEAVGRLKRALSSEDKADFVFESDDLSIEKPVTRADFEEWIAPDLTRISATLDAALADARLEAGDIDLVFLTGGSSLIPAVRAIFADRFGNDRLATGEELTSIAHGLAQIGLADDMEQWIAPEATE
ncbi:Hsp70 family protein [Croceicoccus mobilis]|uniref:Molecular chaperone DnaK n=1 Tax=Croceicoccus mobilis TaxID=1703339 RepID=A0A916YWH7_9SPHN|nr:Hsp70 family protein [Croceicoccus mobilis]GGD64358.1 molecular chaperone DnaK [Croceicoccus mobilis]